MGVRLNKVLSELNIGLQTAVDFLKNKKELGEVKEEMTSNTKISDEQYQALVDEFSGDKAVKTQADKIFVKKVKEKKVEKAEKAEKVEKKITLTEELMDQRPQFKPVGKIDLDSIGKKPVVKEEPKAEPETTAESPVKEPEVEIKEENVVEPAVPETPQVEQSEPGEEVEETTADAGAASGVKVIGKIDLSSINQSTRPKKKSKEERRKEREEKAAAQHQANGERKKRERIRSGKVDIEAAANQANQQQGKKNKNKGGNQNFNDGQQQGGGKKNKKNRPVKPLEVDDEAVARQVKETLARLTSKNQNKKGAKYRREKRDAVQERLSEEMAAEAAESKVLKLTEFVTVSELATMMNCRDHQYRC